jgi:hypothetical protein
MRLRQVLTSSALLSVSVVASAGLPVDIAMRPRPQAYTDTCQSYGLALAAASTPNTPLRATNAGELRVSERELRTARDALAAKTGKSKFDHSLWKDAVEQVSAGALTVDIKYIKNYEDWVAEVGNRTGVKNAQALGPVLSSALVTTPVLTSVNSIGTNTYATGHIVTLVGTAAGNTSPVALAVLNPAVKVGPSPEKVTCEMDDGPGDARYQAFATVESAYKLKEFPAGFLLMTVRKK